MNVKKHVSEIGINGVWNQPERSIYEKRWQMVIRKEKATIATCYRCIETEYRGFLH